MKCMSNQAWIQIEAINQNNKHNEQLFYSKRCYVYLSAQFYLPDATAVLSIEQSLNYPLR